MIDYFRDRALLKGLQTKDKRVIDVIGLDGIDSDNKRTVEYCIKIQFKSFYCYIESFVEANQDPIEASINSILEFFRELDMCENINYKLYNFAQEQIMNKMFFDFKEALDINPFAFSREIDVLCNKYEGVYEFLYDLHNLDLESIFEKCSSK